MKKYFLIISIFSFALISCDNEIEPLPEDVNLNKLTISDPRDTIYFSAGDPSVSLNLTGLYVQENSTTIFNRGILQSNEFVLTTIDSATQSIPSERAEWFSSDAAVASVVNGVVTPANSGACKIWARIGDIASDSINIKVSNTNSAPGLYLNPPASQLVFQNFASVSGYTQVIRGNGDALTNLEYFEARSGAQESIDYDTQGNFNFVVNGLLEGESDIIARATHPEIATLKTERRKKIFYYSFGSGNADAIVGDWRGTTEGRVFNFSVSKNLILNRYDVTGKLSARFYGVGLVDEIEMIGLVNSDGTIQVSLSKTANDYQVSGTLTGYFFNIGEANGEYSAKLAIPGWPELGFKASWEAVKIN